MMIVLMIIQVCFVSILGIFRRKTMKMMLTLRVNKTSRLFPTGGIKNWLTSLRLRKI